MSVNRSVGLCLGAAILLCSSTLDLAYGKPFMIVFANTFRPSDFVAWIESRGVRVLNVAGCRESADGGIGARTRSRTNLFALAWRGAPTS